LNYTFPPNSHVWPGGIRVKLHRPWPHSTEMVKNRAKHEPDIVKQINAATPLRRPADPQEVAEAAAWLLSDRASYVTCVVLPVDGGLRA
jgi:NAD(P)-dependent dehydrogenase (short-subunit alcohol dehydrogenase family)